MRVWVTAVACVLLLAGCADEGTVPDEEFVFEEELEATDSTGIIRGVVVDTAIIPIEGVTISINGGPSATTNADGAFGFEGLDPGTYFFDVTKPGYTTVQQSTEVVAGDSQPPIVRIQMLPDASFIDPFTELLQYNGFYQCGTSAVVVCAAPGIIAGWAGQPDPIGIDSSTPTFYWESLPDFIQTEMIWKSTQTLSTALYYEMEALDTACEGDTFLANARGDSPIRTRVNETVLLDSTIGGDCGIYYSVFSGTGDVPAGFSIEQKFTWYITSFYGFEADEEWWFVEDGAHPLP
ncbi:MAG: carboxypeptidase-like regulatory domain-containing protein [Thermoplasmatota archaeon]